MAQRKSTTMRYVLQMDNRPGELTKLTQLLAQADLSVSGITVASLGDSASIEFNAPAEHNFPELLKRFGLQARVAS